MTIRTPSLPTINTGNPVLDNWISAVNQVVRAREGGTDPLDRFVTLRDIMVANIAEVVINGQAQNRYFGSSMPEMPGGGVIRQIDYTPPPSLAGLTASAALQNVILSWDYPVNENYAHTEVWRSNSFSITTAEKIGTSASNVYVDPVGASSVYRYYWIRQVSKAGIIGPYNKTTGTGAITSQIGITDIGPNSITTAMIVAGAVHSDEIYAGSVIAGKIATNAITADNIQANAITSSKIKADNVTATHMATNSITASNAALENLAVTNAKIKDLAVTEGKIGSLSVTTLKIQDQAVTVPVSAYTASATNLFAAYAAIQWASITSSGAPIQLLFTCTVAAGQFTITAQETIWLRIKRGSTIIWGGHVVGSSMFFGAGNWGPNYLTVAVGLQDTPGAGTYTYSVEMLAVLASISGSAAHARSLVLLEVKK